MLKLPPRQDGGRHRLVLCCPTVTRPYEPFLDAVQDEVRFLEAAGFEHKMVFEVGSAYISWARANMLRKAMSWDADLVVFLDHDLSWTPGHLTKLIQTDGDVVSGLYRFKMPEERYMGTIKGENGGQVIRVSDQAIQAEWVPAGFLRITSYVVHKMMGAFPELIYGPRYNPSFDLFNHGAHQGLWYGEDYAFSRRWNEAGGEIWVVPDLDITHHGPDGTPYPGNYHNFLRRQPGGDLAEAA